MPAPQPLRLVALILLACLVIVTMVVTGTGFVDAREPVPAQATAAPTQSPPAPTAAACGPDRWYVNVHVFPDDVGASRVPGRPPSVGCDGFYTDGDRWSATSCPLDPLWIIVTDETGSRILSSAVLNRSGANADVSRLLTLCEPPPHQVQIVTTRQSCRVLCPNQPSRRLLTEAHFQRSFMGRYAQVHWGFVQCCR